MTPRGLHEFDPARPDRPARRPRRRAAPAAGPGGLVSRTGALLILAALLGCGGGGSGRGEADRTARVLAVRDSLQAARERALMDLAWSRAELRAARGALPYLVVDLPRREVLLKVAGTAYDTLAVRDVDLDTRDGDTLLTDPFRTLLAAQVVTERAPHLDADTTVDKAAAVLARLIPPQPTPLRFLVHLQGASLRFTAGDLRNPWENLKLFAQRSWGRPPAEAGVPRVRADLELSGADVDRLEHFLVPGMPVLVRFPAGPGPG